MGGPGSGRKKGSKNSKIGLQKEMIKLHRTNPSKATKKSMQSDIKKQIDYLKKTGKKKTEDGQTLGWLERRLRIFS
jgi:hypothetical protein